MHRKSPSASAVRSLLCLLLALLAGLHPARAEEVAFGLIVGYTEAADELHRDHTERGPWADKRKREKDAWEHAVKRSREKTLKNAKAAGLRVAGVGEAGRAAVVHLEQPLKGAELDDAMRRLRLQDGVAWVEPNVVERAKAVPNDTYWNNQWHLQTPGTGVGSFQPAAMNLPAAWDITTGAGAGTVVAVVDTGVRFSHPDLAGRLLSGYDFVSNVDVANDGGGRDNDPSDPGDWIEAGDLATPIFNGCPVSDSSWHGTFIAGQIAALSNNGIGVAGLHWDARVQPVRVAGKCGALLSDLLDGLRWAAGLPVSGVPANPNPAKVINLSFGGSSSCTTAYQTTVNDVTAAGSLLVVAAGNNSGALRRPADCSGVMAVTSVRRDGAKADYASFGTNVALAAPGGSLRNASDVSVDYRAFFDTDLMVLSTYNNGLKGPGADWYAYELGTSFAAPQAAGVASLMLTLNPSLSPNALIERMKLGSRAHTSYIGTQCSLANNNVCDCTTTTCGAGLLDAELALKLARGPAAVIAAVGSVLPGASITLDGSGSVALVGRNIVSYRWTQDSGTTTIAIPGDTLTNTGFALPSGVEGRWVFRLTVEDDIGDTGSDTVTVVAAVPQATGGGGGGSIAWWWGAALWAWVLGFGWRQLRRH